MRRDASKLPFALVLILALAVAPRARAAGMPIPHGTVELLSENQSISPGSHFYLGLHFSLEPGWHVYWVNPGDSGQPPSVSWQLPVGITSGEIEWPAPRRLGTPSIVDFGYTDDVMLLAPMRDAETGASHPSALFGADLKVLVCREICMPGKAKLSLSVPIKATRPLADTRARELFSAARKSLPVPAPPAWKFSVSETKDSFLLSAQLGHQVTSAVFFPLEVSQVENSAPQKFAASFAGFELRLRKSDQLLSPVRRLQGVLVISPGNQACTIDVPVKQSVAGK